MAKIKELSEFSSEGEAAQVLSGLRWIGLFSNDPAPVRSGNLLDTLCARLEDIMAFEPGERDLVLLQHKFVVEWPSGEEVSYRLPHTLSLVERRSANFHIHPRAIWQSYQPLRDGVPCRDALWCCRAAHA